MVLVKFKTDFTFHAFLNQHLKEKSFIQYLLEKKIDISILNQKQTIKNSKNEEIGDIMIMHQINSINKLNENNLMEDNSQIKNLNSQLNEEKKKNKQLNYKNSQLIKELNEEREKNFLLNNKIQFLEKSLNKIVELEQIIDKQNKEIYNLKKDIKENNNSIRTIESHEKILAVHFTSTDHKINFSIPCKNTDIFARLEEKLYDEYPDYKEHETYFTVKGTKIKRFKSLEENNIKSGDNLLVYIY